MTTRTISTVHDPRRRRPLLIAIAVAAGMLAFIVALQSLATTSSSAARDSTIPAARTESDSTPSDPPRRSVLAPGEADGVIVEGDQPTVFDVDRPAVANLDPALLDALQRAATNAAEQGVEFFVTGGWRSAALQEKILQGAVATYGSEEEAARWVATADTSLHVSGDAVDLGPMTALDWLAQHGSRYGLCQTYANESWHYELRPDAVDHGCPMTYTDPTEDPRMQR